VDEKMKYKVGDELLCVDSSNEHLVSQARFTVGKKYKITYVSGYGPDYPYFFRDDENKLIAVFGDTVDKLFKCFALPDLSCIKLNQGLWMRK
jgi:hypothetical protein